MGAPTPNTSGDTTNAARGLRAAERARVIAILREHGVLHATLFDSFARGEQRPESDSDLLIDLPVGASLIDLSRLGLALEDALGRSVDLVTALERLHPVIQKRVRHEAETLL